MLDNEGFGGFLDKPIFRLVKPNGVVIALGSEADCRQAKKTYNRGSASKCKIVPFVMEGA